MKIEVGKVYRTRGGRKAYVLGKRRDLLEYPFVGYVEDVKFSWVWRENGTSFDRSEHENDLVAEWGQPIVVRPKLFAHISRLVTEAKSEEKVWGNICYSTCEELEMIRVPELDLAEVRK